MISFPSLRCCGLLSLFSLFWGPLPLCPLPGSLLLVSYLVVSSPGLFSRGVFSLSPLLLSFPLQASTGELLRCLSDFMCRRCIKLKELSSNQIVLWFRNVDGALLVQGWQVGVLVTSSSPQTSVSSTKTSISNRQTSTSTPKNSSSSTQCLHLVPIPQYQTMLVLVFVLLCLSWLKYLDICSSICCSMSFTRYLEAPHI